MDNILRYTNMAAPMTTFDNGAIETPEWTPTPKPYDLPAVVNEDHLIRGEN